jgi:hypothetical protein
MGSSFEDGGVFRVHIFEIGPIFECGVCRKIVRLGADNFTGEVGTRGIFGPCPFDGARSLPDGASSAVVARLTWHGGFENATMKFVPLDG